MMTVKMVSRYTGVSVRTLQYYDKIGLLAPTVRTASGYRLYDDGALERLQQILLFRELEFPLRDIRRILSSPDFDRQRALEQQIALLELKKAHLENLISLAREINRTGDCMMDFSAFDKTKLEDYAKRARDQWGSTDAYAECRQKSANRSATAEQALGKGLMEIFAELGGIRDGAPDSREAQVLIQKLRSYITQHYYNCTPQILAGLGRMYAAGGEFTENIDTAGGPGTALFASEAIAVYCGK